MLEEIEYKLLVSSVSIEYMQCALDLILFLCLIIDSFKTHRNYSISLREPRPIAAETF